MATVVRKLWKSQRIEAERTLWLLSNSNLGKELISLEIVG